MKMRGAAVEEQIQWVLLYVQGGLADIWKENMLEDLKGGLLEYKTVVEFLVDIKKEFGRGNKELVKMAELKRLKQGNKTMEEFVQEFRRVARGSEYEGRLLVKEFKKGINATIHQRLMESKWQPNSIKQQYDRAIALNRNWRKSRRKEKRLRERREQELQVLRLNNMEAQGQQLPRPQV